MKLTFWGTRGSIAVPGPDTLRYGGNTTCVELWLDGGEPVIIDAGTGIRRLGAKLAKAGPLPDLHLLLTHLHWDHVNGFPFFDPIFSRDNVIRVGGWPSGIKRIAGLFDPALSDGRFPIRFDQVPARILKDPGLAPPNFNIGSTEVRSHALNHPQGSIAFRFCGQNGDLVFMTDNELDPAVRSFPRSLLDFCSGAQVLIHDAQYLPEEMDLRKSWGHSDWLSAMNLARAAGVERLILTHHDPNRSDRQIEQTVAQAAQAAAGGLMVEAAFESMTLVI